MPDEPRPAAAPATPLPTVAEVHTRFLFPFYYPRGPVAPAVATLGADTALTGRAFWHREKPPQAYTDEFLKHVVRYLFPLERPADDTSPPECEYLVGDRDAVEKWFRGARVHLPSGASPEIAPRPTVEAFVTSQGVGLLIITLAVKGPIAADDAVSFNYRLSQFRRRPVIELVKPHPSDDPDKWAKVPPGAREKIAQKPDAAAAIEEHLSSAYGRFTLGQLVTRLMIVPPNPLKAEPVEPRELAVYTVVRLPETDFADRETRRRLGPLLSRLAQIEDYDHPGPDPDDLSVPAAVQNRRHWTAVGVLGSAHLVADETEADGSGKEFNNQRVGVVRDKYFVSFLVTMLQRMTLNRAVDEAAEIFRAPEDERPIRTSFLRQNLLQFGVGGQFNQVNSRHAHHRYYQLCRTGLDVVVGWDDIRGILAELDADRVAAEQARQTALQTAQTKQLTEQQAKLNDVAADVGNNVDRIHRIQSFVHVIEFVLGTVYGAHLFHMLFAENHTLMHLTEHVGFDKDGYVTGVTLLGAVLGYFLVRLFNRRQSPPAGS